MKNLYQNLPLTPGVYLMKNAYGEILYVGKAANLRRRVSSYFLKPRLDSRQLIDARRAQDARIQKMVSEIKNIDYQKTGTAIEALILEANLIKKHQPPFNIKEKDDKSFLFIEITDEAWPRVLLVRGTTKPNGKRIGPFTSAQQIRQALKILRKIFPWNTHPAPQIGKMDRACFDYEIGLCPGTCIGVITKKYYLKNIKNLKLFLNGPPKIGEASKKEIIIKNLKTEMRKASNGLHFELAEKIRRQIFALQHIQDIALINKVDQFFPPLKKEGEGGFYRIEGYDISNISGTSAVGAMAVFIGGKPAKSEYRKFKIHNLYFPDHPSPQPSPLKREKELFLRPRPIPIGRGRGEGSSMAKIAPNDIMMLKEMLRRRFNNDWPLPDLILIDGGTGQMNAANQILNEAGLKIPVIGLAKGPKRKADRIVGHIPSSMDKNILIQVRNEAHRFAISYHKKIRNQKFFSK